MFYNTFYMPLLKQIQQISKERQLRNKNKDYM